MKIGFIYGYRDISGTWQYIGQSVNVARRHQEHLKGRSHFDTMLRVLDGFFEGPIVLEKVQGKNEKDIAFNLHWAETVWMFKCKTYHPYFRHGLNYSLPTGTDYHSMGMNGGLVGGPASCQKRKETGQYKSSEHRETCRRNGSLTGKINCQKRKENGQYKSSEHRESCRRAAKITNERYQGTPEQKTWSKKGNIISNHIRWHIKRNIISPTCQLCKGEKS